MNNYKVAVSLPDGENVADFPFECHDDLKRIMQFMTEKGLFGGDKVEIEQFAVGLKLFTGILMRHKGEDLFADLHPAIMAFMHKLKG